MSIVLEEIRNRIQDKDSKMNAFLAQIQTIIQANNNHLNEIPNQLKNYDIHNELHSKKVLENMELILGKSKIHELSFYELIILYLSANLHDCAMSLSNWEFNLLRSVEGTPDIYDNSNSLRINNDFKPCQTLDDVKKFINNNKADIYGNFKNTKDFIFSIKNEEDLQSDLAHRVVDYENFRNSYSLELKKHTSKAADFLQYSERIRNEFIRSTHGTRAADYINNLRDLFVDSIGKVTSNELILGLIEVCKAHSESAHFVYTLSYNYAIGNESVNLQFLALMLRLADVIHFSSDRAPKSLFAEKQITDPISIKHWHAKHQDLNYTIETKHNVVEISFSAFCDTPAIYYFIQNYMDWIDNILDEYHNYINYLYSMKFADIKTYYISICQKINREKISYDKDAFTPDNGLKFSLDQEQILKLLMGTQLYKDKYLCLRELYQNSLDACKCIAAIDNTKSEKEKLFIRFGIGEQLIDETKRKYIYCWDNGSGMTISIVKNHLLRIGNSFYTSKEFARQNTNWGKHIKPTSQFGIGILSCFMLANKIEIITKEYNDTMFSFVMDGISQNSYYIKPDESWKEKIGDHGTLVKLFLKEEFYDDINDYIPDKMVLAIYAKDTNAIEKSADDKFKKSLFYIVNSQVGLPKENIEVSILSNEIFISILPWSALVSHYSIDKNDIKKVWDKAIFFDGLQSHAKEAIAHLNTTTDISIKVSNEDIELYTYMTLPTAEFDCNDNTIFLFRKYIWHSEGTFLVDGISVSSVNKLDFKSKDSNCILNFIGEDRPTLSINRDSILSISKNLEEKMETLFSKLSKTIVATLLAYLNDNKVPFDSKLANSCINSIIVKFPKLSTEILQYLAKSEGKNIAITLKNHSRPQTINDLINENPTSLNNCDLHDFDELYSEIIVSKLISSKAVIVTDKELYFESTDLFPLRNIQEIDFRKSLALTTCIIKADEWKGKFKDYDIVSSLWPVVPPALFTLFDIDQPHKRINERTKLIDQTGNGLCGIANIDPVMIHDGAIYNASEHLFQPKRRGLVGEIGSLLDTVWLFELNQHGRLVRLEKKDYVLFVYISPRKLNAYEEKQLLDYPPDSEYVNGVKEGWSILFIGHECKYYIKPGIVSRNDMYNVIPASLKNDKRDNITYLDINGNVVF